MENYPSFRKIILLLGDIVLPILCFWVSVQTINWCYDYSLRLDFYYMMLPINIIILIGSFGIYGLYSLAKKRYGEIFIGIALSVFYAFVVTMASGFFLREFDYSRRILLLVCIAELVILNLWQYNWWRLERYLDEPKEALLLGGEEECRRALSRLNVASYMKYNVCRIIHDADEKDWREYIHRVDMVIICQDVDIKKKSQIMYTCQREQKQVLLVPSMYELFCSGLEIHKVEDMPFLKPQYINPSLENRSIKRLLDILVSLIALIFVSIPMIIIGIVIKFDSEGPIFYKQVRTGRYGRNFEVFKFRSMRQDAESLSGPVMAGEDDPRITRIGRILRAMRLDELPQFINVIKGDMSIVGPRPERPFFVAQFTKEYPEYEFRHNVRPGITGMAQVYGKYNTTVYDKLVYDLMYVQKCDLLTDLVIIIQTVRVLFQKSSTEGVKKDT